MALSNNPKALLFILGALALYFCGLSGLRTFEVYELKNRGISTTGIIEKYSPYRDNKQRLHYQAVIKAKTETGTFQFEQKNLDANQYPVGKRLELIYLPESPQKAMVVEKVSYAKAPLYAFLSGCFFLICAVGGYRFVVWTRS